MKRTETIRKTYEVIKELQLNKIYEIIDLKHFDEYLGFTIIYKDNLRIFIKIESDKKSDYDINLELNNYDLEGFITLEYVCNYNTETLITNTIKGINKLIKYYNLEE